MEAPRAPEIEISHFVRGEGFVGLEAEAAARSILEAAGLTRPGRQRMASAKLERARLALHGALVGTCDDPACRRAVPPGRRVVAVARSACRVCGGSNTRRALARLVDGLRAASIGRLLVLGGVAGQHRELASTLAAGGIQVQCVDGTGSVPVRDALAAVARAELVVVLASTPLPHKVSLRYTKEARRTGVRCVTVSRRGLEALAAEVLRAVEPPTT